MTQTHSPLRVGVGGPVGSGKTALMEQLCKRLSGAYEVAAITNNIIPAIAPSSSHTECRNWLKAVRAIIRSISPHEL